MIREYQTTPPQSRPSNLTNRLSAQTAYVKRQGNATWEGWGGGLYTIVKLVLRLANLFNALSQKHYQINLLWWNKENVL